MKKFLLSLATAALLAVPSLAQQLNVTPLAQGSKIMLNRAQISQSQKMGLGNDIFTSVPMIKPQSRVAEEVRPHKLLTYTTSLETLGVLNIGAMPYTFEEINGAGFSGYGFAQLFLKDMLSRYVGNTIQSIEFCSFFGKYSKGQVFIIDAGTGQTVWQASLDKVDGMNMNAQGQLDIPSNIVECNYTITGEESALYIGWVADCKPVKLPEQFKPIQDNLVMPMHLDETGVGLGANLLVCKPTGEIGILGSYAQWNMTDENGNESLETNCAYIVVNTDGENGLKDNDAQVGDVTTIRVEQKSGVGSSSKVSVLNLGLDPIDSFDYKFETNGVVKEGTCVLEEPLPFYSFTTVNLDAAYPDQPGRADGTFVITKVNEVDDENIDNEDNEAKYEALVFDKGYRRMPVVETFTSSQCPWCPIVGPALMKIDKQVNGHFIPLNVHIDMSDKALDPLKANDTYMDIYNKYVPGGGTVPASMVNREVSGDPYTAAPLGVDIINQSICEANMKVKVGSVGHALNKQFEVSTDVNLTFDAPASAYSIAYVVTEDGVTGVSQVNNFAALFFGIKAQYPTVSEDAIFEAMQQDTGFDFLGDENLRKICKMGKPNATGETYVYTPVYTDVACTITDAKDNLFVLPAISVGQTYTHTTSLLIPTRQSPKVNRKNLSVTALLIDKKSGVIVTAARAKVGEESVESGLEKIENESNVQIEAANGAFQVVAENAVAEVYTVDGKLVSSASVKGNASLPTFGKGVFVIRVVEGKNVTSKKAVF